MYKHLFTLSSHHQIPLTDGVYEEIKDNRHPQPSGPVDLTSAPVYALAQLPTSPSDDCPYSLAQLPTNPFDDGTYSLAQLPTNPSDDGTYSLARFPTSPCDDPISSTAALPTIPSGDATYTNQQPLLK